MFNRHKFPKQVYTSAATMGWKEADTTDNIAVAFIGPRGGTKETFCFSVEAAQQLITDLTASIQKLKGQGGSCSA